MNILNACPFRLSDDKTRILWEITPKCNMKCKHCLFYSANDKKTMNELSFADVCKIIDNVAKDKNVSAIWLSGGEPLLRKDIVDICDRINNNAIIPSISTNGTLLTEDLIGNLYNAGVRYIHLSIDGATEQTHDSLRGVSGSFNKLMNAIKLLNKSKITIGASFMVTNNSFNEIGDVLDIALKSNFQTISFYIVANLGRAITNFRTDDNNLSIKLHEKLHPILNDSSTKIEFFRANNYVNKDFILQDCKGYNFLNITYDGLLGACPWFMKSPNAFTVGSLLDNDFVILSDFCKIRMKEFVDMRKQNISYCKENCKNNSYCGKGCPALSINSEGKFYMMDNVCNYVTGLE